MIKAKGWFIFGCVILCGAAAMVFADDSKRAAAIPAVPVPGLVTMVDLGAHTCIPCKMMAPILAELQKEYDGRAAIIFIDVWEHKGQAKRFGIRSIPTQIFYDKKGVEVSRHVGFMDKKSIVARFDNLGVPPKAGQ